MIDHYYGHYSDGMISNGRFDSLQEAVKYFSKDIYGHRITRVLDSGNVVRWSLEGGFSPLQPMSVKAIDNLNIDDVLDALDLRNVSNLVNEGGIYGANTGVSFSYKDGKIVLSDAQGKMRRAIQISVKEVPIATHSFNAEFNCDICNQNMMDLEDPTGLCA